MPGQCPRASFLRKPARRAPAKSTSNAHTSITRSQRPLGELIKANFRTRNWLTVSQKTSGEHWSSWVWTWCTPQPAFLQAPGPAPFPAAPGALLNSTHTDKDDPRHLPFPQAGSGSSLCIQNPKHLQEVGYHSFYVPDTSQRATSISPTPRQGSKPA